MNWSKPYYGVSHLLDVAKGKHTYISVSEHATFVDVYVIVGPSFTPVAEETFYGEGAVERAKSWGEKQAKLRGVV